MCSGMLWYTYMKQNIPTPSPVGSHWGLE